MLSVALCTFNGEKYLDQQLISILTQSKPIDEIIICDDGSIDNTINIINNFQVQYPSKIKLYKNQPPLGAIKNFEKAISLCGGEIVFLSDQDDIWIENKVELITEKFKTNPSLEAIFSDADLIDHDGKLLNKKLFEHFSFDNQLQESWIKGKALLDLVYFRNKITGATLAIKKELFDRAFPFSTINKFWHDAYLGLHAAANNTLGWINEPLIHYRIHSSQQVGIGNGITINNEIESSNLKAFLIDLKTFFSNCLLVANNLIEKYPHLEKEKLEIKSIKNWINYIDIRLHLPENIFFRTIVIVKNTLSYTKHSRFFLKSMLRDVINPCK